MYNFNKMEHLLHIYRNVRWELCGWVIGFYCGGMNYYNNFIIVKVARRMNLLYKDINVYAAFCYSNLNIESQEEN